MKVLIKFSLQLIVSVFLIAMAVFFISHEHLEVQKIAEHLALSNPWYIALGISITGLYIWLQAQMYVHSFRATGAGIPVIVALRLFLKRNLVSVFLPAGGFSSLVFFTKDVENEGINKSQIHLASTLFGFMSILSVLVVALPVLGIAMFFNHLQSAELLGFGFLLALIAGFVFFLFSVSKKGKAYRWLALVRPSAVQVLDEMIARKIDRKQVGMVLLTSTIIELIGILHLYVAMLALGFEPSWPAAILGYVVMVVILIASPVLRGLGTIEVSLTIVLGQFGFPIVAAAAIVLLYRFFEFWLPLLAGLVSFISKRDNLILRVLPAMIIFILGIVNIISAITPSLPERIRLLKEIIPNQIIATTNGFVLVSGLLLILLSVYLLRGSRRAWYIGVTLTLLSVFGHLLKAVDYEEAIVAFVAFVVLLYTKKFYKLRPHPRFTKIGYSVLLYSLAALFFFGIISLNFIDKRHFGIDFEFWPSVKTIFRLFILFSSEGLEPKTAFAQDFLYALYTAAGLVYSFVFFNLLKPYFVKPYNTDEEKELARKLVEKYGKSALDYFKTYPDKFLFLANDRDGFISFKVTRHFAIVLENPVCKDEPSMEKLIREFDGFCDENGFVGVWYRVPELSLNIYSKLGKRSLPIGEEGIVDLTTLTLEGQKIRTTRSAINRLTSEGYKLFVYNPPIKEGLLQKLKQVSDAWLEELNQKEVAFTQGIFDGNILKTQTIVTVEDNEEKVYAFLNIIPDYAPGETTYDIIRKVTDAPNGVLDMLLMKTLLYMKEQGFRSANLGMVPFSGIEGKNLTEKSMRFAYENIRTFGHYKGLRKYKEKFFPAWEQKYLIYENSYHLLQIPNALKRVMEGK